MYLLPLDLTPTNHHMESSSWPESLPSIRIKAIEELTKGQLLTNKLREMLNQPERIESGAMSVDGVVAEISVMFETTISILTSFEVNEIHPNFGDTAKSPSSWDDRKSEDSGESVKTAISLKPKRGCYKRRKNASSTVIKETSTLIDDGYAWRKYGQKVIQNSIHQRNYYRCTHKFEQGCLATKQVQKTDHQPPKYRITYSGYHTCKNLSRTPQIILDSPNPSENLVLLNFETNTTLVDNKQVGSFSSSMKERLPSLGMKHEQVSPSEDYVPWDVVDTRLSQVSSAPMSMMSSGLDHEDMVSSGLFSSTCSTHGYEMDDILRSNNFDDFPFEFC